MTLKLRNEVQSPSIFFPFPFPTFPPSISFIFSSSLLHISLSGPSTHSNLSFSIYLFPVFSVYFLHFFLHFCKSTYSSLTPLLHLLLSPALSHIPLRFIIPSLPSISSVILHPLIPLPKTPILVVLIISFFYLPFSFTFLPLLLLLQSPSHQ